MAVAIATAPDTVSFTGIPIDFTVTSNRDSADAQIGTAVSNSGGYCSYAYNSHPYIAGDVITCSAFTNTAINVRQTVSSVSANAFVTTLAWASAYTGDTGTVTRTNDNFQIKAEVIINSSTIATLRKYGTSGNYTFDVSKILDARLTSAPKAIGGLVPVADTTSITDYTVKFTEEFDDVSGLITTGANTTSATLYAVKGTRQYADTQSTAAYLVASADMPYLTTAGTSRWMAPGEEIQLSFIKTSSLGGTSWRIYTTENIIGGTTGNTASSSATIADTVGKVVIPLSDALFTNDIAACTSITVRAQLSVSGNWLNFLENVTIYPLPAPPSHGKRIWWLNKLGGWDQYTFRGEYLKERDVERTTYRKDLGYSYSVGARGLDVADTKVTEVHTTYSEAIGATESAWISDIMYSKDVRLQSGSTFIPIVVQDGSQVIESSHEHVVIKLEYVHANDVR